MKSIILIIVLLMSTVSSYSQNQKPVAVRDTASTMAEVSVTVNVLRNDYDPDGDSLMIDTYSLRANHYQVLNKINDSVLLYRSLPSFTGTDTITYRVRKTKSPFFYSNFAKAVIHVGPNPLIPVAVNDTVDYLSFSTKHIIPLQNDAIPTSDSMEIIFQPSQPSYITVNNDQSVE